MQNWHLASFMLMSEWGKERKGYMERDCLWRFLVNASKVDRVVSTLRTISMPLLHKTLFKTQCH